MQTLPNPHERRKKSVDIMDLSSKVRRTCRLLTTKRLRQVEEQWDALTLAQCRPYTSCIRLFMVYVWNLVSCQEQPLFAELGEVLSPLCFRATFLR